MSTTLLRLSQLKCKVPYSTSTIYMKIERGEFPRPVSMGGRAVAWVEGEIDEWIAARINARDAGEAGSKQHAA